MSTVKLTSLVCVIHIRLLFALSVVVNKTSQELQMLSSVTFSWKVTMNDRTVVWDQRYIGQELLKVMEHGTNFSSDQYHFL